MSTIPDQIKLPLSVAVDVALQGIRIRLGRSLVTLTGVICGIAFLMSILTGQVIRKGVADEEALRIEVDRMMNFLRADMPSLAEKRVSLIVSGNLAEAEKRLLLSLQDAGVNVFEVLPDEKSNTLPVPVEAVSSDRFAEKSSAVFALGHGSVKDRPWREWLDRGHAKSMASTHSLTDFADISEGRFVPLSRTLDEEEKASRLAEARKARYRNVWIGIVSLLVTVIGIANAMLMSVTERFREIGTMKCLGALSAFIRKVFLVESSLMGVVGGTLGAVAGATFSTVAYSVTYSFSLVWESLPLGTLLLFTAMSVAAGVLLSVVAALYPAHVASRMVPATALRSNV